MNEDIKKILDTIKEHYEDIGCSYYPEDLLERDDPKIIYDYINQLHNNWNELKKWLLDGTKEDNWVQGDMFWKEACKSVINKMQEMEQGKDE